MSWFTVFARNIGLGPMLDAIEGVEANATPETISAAIAALLAAAPNAASIAITDLGTMADQVLVGAATKVNPTLGSVTAEVAGPLLQELEQVAIKWLSGVTGGVA